MSETEVACRPEPHRLGTVGSEVFGSGDPLDPNIIPGPVHGFDDEGILAAAPSFREGGPSLLVTLLILGAVIAAAIIAVEVMSRRRRHPAE